LLELGILKIKWGEKDPIVIGPWKNNWANFFQYTAQERKMIYTTNIIEGLK
jgi:transposase-like protein